jgi:hypothetical protein
MKKALLALLKKLEARNFTIHTNDSGAFTGLTAYDVKSFETAPIEAILLKMSLGWIVISNPRPELSNNGNMLPPRMYIGQTKGGTIDDVATALDSLDI